MSKILSALVCMLIVGTGITNAQSPVLDQVYGRGVHLFYAGQLAESYEILSSAITAGSHDPRTFYFRGLAAAASGRQHEAETDWREGAKYEMSGTTTVSVGHALQRIQGSTRLELERIRQLVRLEMRANDVAKSKARYQELKAVEPDVLRGAGARPPAATTRPATRPATPANPSTPETNIFGDGAAAPMSVGEPRVDSADPLGNPFGDDATTANPSGAPATPAETPAADAFGTPATPATPDPFGAPAAEGAAPMTEPNPFGGDANPFGT